MIRAFSSFYSPRLPVVLVYMLQSTEYQIGPYIRWLNRTRNFNAVMKRRTLDPTKSARLLLLGLRAAILLQVLLGLFLIYAGHYRHLAGGVFFGLAVIVIYPIFWMYALPIPLLLAKWFIVMPKEAQLIAESEKILAGHPGIKIAVAGSYGKTTMKELLSTVLGESKKVAATPANKNVAISHAVFAKHLQGDEEFVIIEYGEGAPGDVARFAHNTHPDYGVITGLAPAHLDHYKTLEAAGKDIFSLATYLNDTHVYVNDMAPSVKPFLKKQYELFDTEHAMGWKISDIKIAMEGTDFTIRKAKMNLVLHSNLLGRHQVAYLAFVAAFGLEHGMTEKAVATGIADTRPFEHRMQPYRVAGAWVIDDTYNGNLEGIRAGTALLSELEAKRKVYITPGLVDQGRQTERIHVEVGELIANAKPDLVVLMKNSVSAFIEKGLRNAGFKGTLQLEYNPLEFYTNLDQFVAAGDIVMMQNDWPDNYA